MTPTATLPLHPWWCADQDDDPHLRIAHHSEFEGVVDAAHSLVAVGLVQEPGGPVRVQVSVATGQVPHIGEADVRLSYAQALWLWRKMGVRLLEIAPIWLPTDLAADPYLRAVCPPDPDDAFPPDGPPLVDVDTLPDRSTIRLLVPAENGSLVAPAMTHPQAVRWWRYLTSHLKRLGVIPMLDR